VRHALWAAVCAGTLLSATAAAQAWGTTGHHEINLVAMRALPPELPSFLKTDRAVTTVEALGPEEDFLKGAGVSWDHDDDPAHYVDVGDNGMIGESISLHRLPDDMEAYADALASSGSDPYRVGYLPYAIADGWEQLRKDFAYWRAFDYLARSATEKSAAASFASARALREALIIHDIGVWGHFVGDGSQPLHVSVHYNGWGDYPNPKHYTAAHIHAAFEGAFVRDHVGTEAVARLVPPGAPQPPDNLLTQTEILSAIGTYLAMTSSHVEQLYEIEKRGGFRDGSSEAVEFTTARVADGARELRDLVALAWDDSLYDSVGYPEISVQAILSGKITPPPSAFGGD
jgi:hypothetical protein